MLSDAELAKISTEYGMRFEAINVKYLELMGKHIKEIGTLTASDVHRLQQMQKYGGNIKAINEMIAKECNRTTQDLSALYEKLMKEEYSHAKELYLYAKGIQVPLYLNKRLQTFLESMKRLTNNTFQNMSRTTVIDKQYRDLVDTAVQAVATGTSDFNTEVTDAIKSNPVGAKVEYASGYIRRLDSAVRMNVMEGVRQLNMGTRQIMGEQFGADGYEISAHALCAPDHMEIQGRQYAKGYEEKIVKGVIYQGYESMNESLKRHIGTCNCKHYIFPIILGISHPTYSYEDLMTYKSYSESLIEVNGKHISRYQCSQMQRKLETKMRYEKDNIIFSRNAGLDDAVKAGEKRLKELQAKYRNVSNVSGLSKQYNRAYVPGYK